MLLCPADAQHAIALDVAETAGIRRTEFPVEDYRLAIPAGRLADVNHIRVRLDDRDVPGQFTAVDRWPDGSLRQVSLDFNVSIGPGEARSYRVEYGPDTAAGPPVARGLSVVENTDSIQAGALRFSKSGFPLIQSANYRGEFIAAGSNGLVLVDAAGGRHDFSSARDVSMRIEKSGPLNVALHYSGRVPVDAAQSVSVALHVTLPNSKSWARVSAAVDDPDGLVKEIALDLPLAFGAHPWTWDFGTDSGTYGAFRAVTDQAVLTKNVEGAAQSEWSVTTKSGAAGADPRLYETSGGRERTTAAGWTHLVDGTKALAVAIPQFDRTGTHTIRLAGDGSTTVAFAPAGSRGTQTVSAVYHFVSAPVAIGAATSPASILSPLKISAR